MSRHIIKGSERGHRAPLSKEEPTEQYGIKVVRSLKQKLVSIGPAAVRKILTDGTFCAKESGIGAGEPSGATRPDRLCQRPAGEKERIK